MPQAKPRRKGGFTPPAQFKSSGSPPDRISGGADGNINAVMDGDLDGFINAYLTASATGELKK